MIRKFLLNSIRGGMAIKIDPDKGVCVVGGHGALVEEMRFMVYEVFGSTKRACRETWTQRNKVRITFKIGEKEFDKRMEQATKERNFTFDPVKVHGRIMR